MKGSVKSLLAIAAVAFLVIFYVHFQLGSVIVSLDIDKNKKSLEQKQEILRKFAYKIEQLRAPRLLEEKMKHYDMGLTLPNKVQVVEVPAIADRVISAAVLEKTTRSFSSEIMNFFGKWIQTAQAAKTDSIS